MRFSSLSPGVVTLALCVFVTNPVLARDTDLLIGDIGQVLVPAAGLALTYRHDDPEGRVQWAKTVGTTVVATEALKYGFDRTDLGRRPNGATRSFPSGHTSSACAGSFFIGERYDWTLAAAGFALSAFTAYSRIDENMHHWRDVIAGCALGYASARYFVDTRHPAFSVLPVWDRAQHGIALRYRY